MDELNKKIEALEKGKKQKAEQDRIAQEQEMEMQ